MALPGIPQNLYVSQANGKVYLQWDISTGSTSYNVQRSTDGVTYSSVAHPALNNYTDTTVTLATNYYYQVAATNASGTSAYTAAQSVVPTTTGELSLGELRTRCMQKADRLGSNFVTQTEWNYFINQSMFELYDLLVDAYEDYFVATPAQFNTNGSQYLYPLPDGQTSFVNGISGASSYIAPPFYKLMGVDLGLQTANNAWVTVNKFMFNDRNNYIYPNTSSTIYGVFNLQYRLVGSNIEFIPTPSSNQPIRIWYIPRLQELLADTDMTTIGISGWLQYVIVRAAKYALDKEESNTETLTQEIVYLKGRIEESAQNRDAGQPDRITDIRKNGMWNSGTGGYGGSFPMGGF